LEPLTDPHAVSPTDPPLPELFRAILAANNLVTWRKASLKALFRASQAQAVGLFLLSPTRTNLVLQGVEGPEKAQIHKLDLIVAKERNPGEPLVSARAGQGTGPIAVLPLEAKQVETGAVVLLGLPSQPAWSPEMEHCLAITALQYQLIHDEQVLGQQISQSQAIVDALPIGIFIQDRLGKVVYANGRLASMVGRSIPEVVGAYFAQLMVPGEVELLDKITQQVWDGGRSWVSEAFLTLAGQRTFVQIGTLLIRPLGSAYPQLLGYLVDLSDRKRTEDALVQARALAEASERAKDGLLAMMNFEARLPIDSIVANAQLLLDQQPAFAQLGPLRTLKSAADQLMTLTNNMLDFSQIQQGNIDIAPANFKLDVFLEGLAHRCRAKAQETGLRFDLVVTPSLPTSVKGDRLRLGQVLEHLLDNAFNFTKVGGVLLSVACQTVGPGTGQFVFEVRDTGIGIPASQLAQVFQPFVHVGPGHLHGPGLGLSIAQKLAEMQEGQLTATSTEGQGSTFRLEVPLLLTTDADEAEAEATTGGQFEGLAVLLVEDTPANQLAVSRFLRKWGMVVDLAPDGLVALYKTTEQAYDLILMDLQMPNMDGWEATQQIRHDPLNPCHMVPIVALSADVSDKTRERLLQTGFAEVLFKPVAPSALYQLIARLFPEHAPEVGAPALPHPANQKLMADYTFIAKAAEGDHAFMALMLNMAASEFEETANKFVLAVEAANTAEARRLKHKIMPHLESYKLADLEHLFVTTTNLMGQPGYLPDRATSLAKQIGQQVGTLCLEFKAEAAKLEQLI
jgi:PAS domain S-box-containing protein